MTNAQVAGAIILAVAVVIAVITYKFIKPRKEALMGMIMLICFVASVSYAFFRTGELEGERREHARACLDAGYALDINGHEIFSGNVDLDQFVVTGISDGKKTVYLDITPDSPEWSRFGE